ncbi:hypothetical protein HPP92_024726 [Vanilla planifolia]|uniref:Cytochrome P450 n=1 Tax=Vanilla planifolia TaxID=51239 RepID=A0A835PLC7_VANPL|nr:hypothetical protein HPP92_024726 [Vanilla planifolia]
MPSEAAKKARTWVTKWRSSEVRYAPSGGGLARGTGDTGIYRSHLFGSPVIITCSPEFNKQALCSLTEDGTLSSGWPSDKLLGSSSIAVVDGVLHKRLRKHLIDGFTSPKVLSVHLSIAQPVYISALENCISKGKIVAYDETKAMTFRNICEALVSFKSEELLETMECLYRGLMKGLRSLTINIPGTAYYHALKCKRKLIDILLGEIRERNLQRVEKHDFLQFLMNSIGEDGLKLEEVEVVEIIVMLILASYETTSDVMTWGLYYLAKHPEILEKVKVAEELVRLANISPFIFRRVAKDDAVINGYKLPNDWNVIVWIRSIHIDSKYYSDPLAFNPDRWTDFKPKLGTYSVFGAGPRHCPGSSYAKHQTNLALVNFYGSLCAHLTRWELLNPDAGFAYQPHPRPRDGAKMTFCRADEDDL